MPITPLLNNYLLTDLELDVGVDLTVRPAARWSDRFIDDDVLDLEHKIS
jgi:hypothetical protein